MKLALPLRGVSDVLPSSAQRQDTTRDMLNMRGEDPRTKQTRLAQRSGLSKYLDAQVNGSNPIRGMRSVSFQRKNVLYTDKVGGPVSTHTPLGDADVKWSAVSSSKLPTPGVCCDSQGNVYTIDGLAGIQKHNSDGKLQWLLALPVRQESAVVRALRVARVPIGVSDGDVVFAGVSAGGLQSDTLLWAYKQINTKDNEGNVETKTEKVFELETEAYVEVIRVRDSFLYTAQNEPDKGRAFVRIYIGMDTPNPTLVKAWEIPYPVNGMDVHRSTGEVITAHPPNLLRGLDPRLKDFTARDLAREWKLSDLVDYDKRIWCDLDASTLGAALNLSDGDTVALWPDAGSGTRNLFAPSATVTTHPFYIENGIGGLPALRFAGGSAAPALSPVLTSATNPGIQAHFADQQKTMLPAHLTGKWAVFMVLRIPPEALTRPVFFQDNQHPAGSDADSDQLLANTGSSFIATLDPTGDGNVVPGQISWRTMTVDTVGEGGASGTTAGSARSMPFQGTAVFSKSTGTVLVTLVYDGKSNPTSDAAQHATWRVNGRPLDRWLSSEQAGILQTALGSGSGAITTFLNADVARIIVLRDYPSGVDHTGSGNAHGDPVSGNLGAGGPPAVFHYPCAIGTFGTKTARAYTAAAGNRFNDNEIERIEGMLAGEYGVSHILPCGTASVLSATAIPVAGDTVTIDGTQYTFVAALTGVTGEIFIEANCALTMANLFRAINGTGSPGIEYSEQIVAHTTVRATALNDAVTGTAHIKIETHGLGTVAVSEVSGVLSWSNNPTTATIATVTATAATYMPGHYPHPFAIQYGYPRKDVGAAVGSTLESKGKMLASTEGIMARWDANGKCAWVLTSRLATVTPGGTLPATDQKFGGIGYDCAFAALDEDDESDGGIYSVGPMYSTAPGSQSEQACIRRVIDNKTSVAVTGEGTWTLTPGLIANAGANDSLDYQYVRIAVDTFDRVYLPYYEIGSTGVISLACIRTHTVAGTSTGIVDWTWRRTSGTTNPAGLCVAVDEKQPEYDGDPATRAFSVYLGTRKGNTVDAEQATIYKIESVVVTHLDGVPPSETRLVAVSNGSVKTSLAGGAWQNPSGINTLANPVFALDSANRDAFYSMATLNGEVFITDGRQAFVYNARLDTLTEMKAKSAGEFKPRARLVCAWRGRLVWARFADNPHEILMSRLGDPYDYDTRPPVSDPTQAVQLSTAPKGTGQSPDIITALFPLSNETLGVGCESSVWVIEGDPMDGVDFHRPTGRFLMLSDATGMPFGDPWCKDEAGVVYFMGNRGCAYAIGKGMIPLSENAIPERLRSIDFSTTRVRCVWNSEDQGFHTFFTPIDARVGSDGDAVVRDHYFWSRKAKGWYPDSFNSIDLQPTATFIGDGDLASNRSTIVGCMDGYARKFDSSVDDDDGVAILSRCLIGPLPGLDSRWETHFKELQAVLSRAQGGCGYRFFASNTPDDLGDPIESGQLDPGRNGTHFIQGVGAFCALEVSNSTRERFAIESLDMQAFPAGQAHAT